MHNKDVCVYKNVENQEHRKYYNSLRNKELNLKSPRTAFFEKQQKPKEIREVSLNH